VVELYFVCHLQNHKQAVLLFSLPGVLLYTAAVFNVYIFITIQLDIISQHF